MQIVGGGVLTGLIKKADINASMFPYNVGVHKDALVKVLGKRMPYIDDMTASDIMTSDNYATYLNIKAFRDSNGSDIVLLNRGTLIVKK